VPEKISRCSPEFETLNGHFPNESPPPNFVGDHAQHTEARNLEQAASGLLAT
jgi:hypothetical protein